MYIKSVLVLLGLFSIATPVAFAQKVTHSDSIKLDAKTRVATEDLSSAQQNIHLWQFDQALKKLDSIELLLSNKAISSIESEPRRKIRLQCDIERAFVNINKYLFSEASQQLSEVIGIAKSLPLEQSTFLQCESEMLLGQIDFLNDRYYEAIATYDRILDSISENKSEQAVCLKTEAARRIARAFLVVSEVKKSKEYLDISLKESGRNNNYESERLTLEKISTLRVLCELLISQYKKEEAISAFSRGVSLCQAKGPWRKYELEKLTNLSLLYLSASDLYSKVGEEDISKEFALKSLSLINSNSNLQISPYGKVLKCCTYRQIGTILSRQGDSVKAINSFQKSLDELNGIDQINSANPSIDLERAKTLICMGACYFEKSEPTRAISSYEGAVKYLEKFKDAAKNSTIDELLTNAHLEIANIFLAENELDRAHYEIQIAGKILTASLNENSKSFYAVLNKGQLLKLEGDLCMRRKDYDAAEKKLNQSILEYEGAKTTQLRLDLLLRNQARAFHSLAVACANSQKWSAARENFKRAVSNLTEVLAACPKNSSLIQEKQKEEERLANLNSLLKEAALQ